MVHRAYVPLLRYDPRAKSTTLLDEDDMLNPRVYLHKHANER